MARTVLAAAVHAIRVLLLFGAFTRAEFLLVVLAGAAAAVVTDAWWVPWSGCAAGVRVLQRGGSLHRVPRADRLVAPPGTRLTALGLGLTGMAVAWSVLLSPGGLGPG